MTDRPIQIHLLPLPTDLTVPAQVQHHRHNHRLDTFIRRNCGADFPAANTPILTCKVEIEKLVFRAYAWGHHIFVQAENLWLVNGVYHDQPQWFIWAPIDATDPHSRMTEQQDVEPFVKVELLDDAYYQTLRVPNPEAHQYQRQPLWGRRGPEPVPNIQARDEYRTRGTRSDASDPIPWIYQKARITCQGVSAEGDFKFQWPNTGVAILTQDPDSAQIHVSATVQGLTRSWIDSLAPTHGLTILTRHLQGSDRPGFSGNELVWWDRWLRHNFEPYDLDEKGIVGIKKRKGYKEALERLHTEQPTVELFFQWLHSSMTRTKTRNNTLLTAFLKTTGGDYDKILEGLRGAIHWASTELPGGHRSVFESYHRREICLTLPGAKETVKKATTKSFANEADALGIGEEYPKLRKAVIAGKIPARVFRNPDKQLVNREFAIWERALGQKGWPSVIYEIAQNASKRTTYEKDIVPFLNFLFRLPLYLDRNTPGSKKWCCVPRFVQSQWELEMDDTPGTTKQRSAFTPVADNENRVVTVPYVAVSVGGFRTQWCYSRHYYVFEEGLTDPESGGIVVRDVEPKLNGRDDYGLMYFTLTGTKTARGYPTFLIIFERLGGDTTHDGKERLAWTRVHFHRVHPKRKVKGVKTPACELVEAVYQYMVGDVPAAQVTAQQGDMVYIRHPNDPVAAGAKVEEPQVGPVLVFESHSMQSRYEGPDYLLKLYLSKARTPQNRLGFIEVPAGGMSVRHPEHDDIDYLEMGWYEVRRCRSWEANPKSIWSLTID